MGKDYTVFPVIKFCIMEPHKIITRKYDVLIENYRINPFV
jgi:hypothetical protein